MANARRAVRELLAELELEHGSLLLVACSGGPDSMALAAAAAFEVPKAGHKVGAVIIDHGLQGNSQEVADQAAHRCSELGLAPVLVEQVRVTPKGEGLEAVELCILLDEPRDPRACVANCRRSSIQI